jgi:deferrochelatase/peroxidase EfeB
LAAYEKELQRLRTELEEKSTLCEQGVLAESKLQQLTVVAQQWQSEAEKYKQWALQWQSYQISQVIFFTV